MLVRIAVESPNWGKPAPEISGLFETTNTKDMRELQKRILALLEEFTGEDQDVRHIRSFITTAPMGMAWPVVRPCSAPATAKAAKKRNVFVRTAGVLYVTKLHGSAFDPTAPEAMEIMHATEKLDRRAAMRRRAEELVAEGYTARPGANSKPLVATLAQEFRVSHVTASSIVKSLGDNNENA